ncbi:MAG: N-acetyltransferase [Acidimicrobiales bacterium]
MRPGATWLIHTEIDPAREGMGVGSFLVRSTLDQIRAEGGTIVPTCPFVGSWIRRHPDYADLVDREALRAYKRSRSPVALAATPADGCAHIPDDYALIAAPWPLDGCAECIAVGHRDWVHLRMCQTCGHIGCCDNSPGKHGTAHFNLADHPLIRSFEPGENWWYCYLDDVTFERPDAPAAPSYP